MQKALGKVAPVAFAGSALGGVLSEDTRHWVCVEGVRGSRVGRVRRAADLSPGAGVERFAELISAVLLRSARGERARRAWGRLDGCGRCQPDLRAAAQRPASTGR